MTRVVKVPLSFYSATGPSVWVRKFSEIGPPFRPKMSEV